MKRIGMFVDVSNLYYCIQKKFPKRKLDYRKYKRFVEDLGDIHQAIAYGAQMSRQADGFKYCLEQIGYTAKYKTPKVYVAADGSEKRKADWDVGIAMDMVSMIDRFDMIILGSGDGDMLPVVEWCMRRGVDVVILATGISKDLKRYATQAIEIPESLLEAVKPKGAIRPNEMAEKKIKEGAEPKSLHTVSNNREDSRATVHAPNRVSGSVAKTSNDGACCVPDSDSSNPNDNT